MAASFRARSAPLSRPVRSVISSPAASASGRSPAACCRARISVGAIMAACPPASTAASMEQLGLPHTKIHAKVFRSDTSIFPERSRQFGLGSTTAAETLRLLELIYRNEAASPEACEEMLGHLRACENRTSLPRFLPDGTKVAFKTGSVTAVRTAGGIIESPCGAI
ncbi:MAG: class A beta-lactamase-related serine hydrolase, partial [Proteobacteria bacterium]|nr:class A beta-lactamase-related serine hydrolase [Pseudomonadota bacterium]